MKKFFKVIIFFIIAKTQFCISEKDNKNKLILGLILLNSQATNIPYPVATRVYGQNGSMFTNTHSNGGVSANSLFAPNGVLLDSNNGLYISDTSNGRVLYYPSNSTTATKVYGQQGNFTTFYFNQGGISANTLYNPTGMVLDSNNGLYVADSENSRVLYYPTGSTTATRVYGQNGNFTTNTSNNGGVSANSLNSIVRGLAVDANNGLYIADTANYRVLYYPSGSTTATRVYGQNGNFTTNSKNTVSANSLNAPNGLALDKDGGLYVSDTLNHRVLYYSPGSTTASRVYGQNGNFTTSTPHNENTITANTLANPKGLAIDSSGGLFISDEARILYYSSGSTTATRVYGQNGSMTSYISSKSSGVSALTLDTPNGLAVDSNGRLYVADELNSRVLYY